MPLIIEIIKPYWKPLLIGFVIILWSLGCYNQGKRAVQSEWDKSILEATLRAHEIERDNAVLSNIIEGKHYAGIKAIDDNFNAALASLQPASSDMPAKTSTSGKPDAAACDYKLYRANKRKLLEIAKQADIQTQQLIRLQEWERGVK